MGSIDLQKKKAGRKKETLEMTTSPMVTPQAPSSGRPGRLAAPSLRRPYYEMGRAGGSCEATRSPLGGKPTPNKPMSAVADGVVLDHCLVFLARVAEATSF